MTRGGKRPNLPALLPNPDAQRLIAVRDRLYRELIAMENRLIGFDMAMDILRKTSPK
jgi:hypothetical protein